MKPLIVALALAYFVVVPPSTPTGNVPGQMPFTEQELGELKSERQGMCPDGAAITLRLYDPDPSDSQAVIFVFARGAVPVAVREFRGGVDRVYIVAEGRWYPIDEIRERYPNPCDIPFAGR